MSGLKIGEARLAFQLISDQLVEVKAANQPAWMLKSQLAWLGETLNINPVVRLLPASTPTCWATPTATW